MTTAACKKASVTEAAKPSSTECDKLIDHQADLLAGPGASQGAKDAARVTLIKSETTLVRRGKGLVAEPEKPLPKLTAAQVRATLESGRR